MRARSLERISETRHDEEFAPLARNRARIVALSGGPALEVSTYRRADLHTAIPENGQRLRGCRGVRKGWTGANLIWRISCDVGDG
jgi:hypothetical protein